MEALKEDLKAKSNELAFAENTVKNLTENLETVRISSESNASAARKLLEEEKNSLRDLLEKARNETLLKERENWTLKTKLESIQQELTKSKENIASRNHYLEEENDKLK